MLSSSHGDVQGGEFLLPWLPVEPERTGSASAARSGWLSVETVATGARGEGVLVGVSRVSVAGPGRLRALSWQRGRSAGVGSGTVACTGAHSVCGSRLAFVAGSVDSLSTGARGEDADGEAQSAPADVSLKDVFVVVGDEVSLQVFEEGVEAQSGLFGLSAGELAQLLSVADRDGELASEVVSLPDTACAISLSAAGGVWQLAGGELSFTGEMK